MSGVIAEGGGGCRRCGGARWWTPCVLLVSRRALRVVRGRRWWRVLTIGGTVAAGAACAETPMKQDARAGVDAVRDSAVEIAGDRGHVLAGTFTRAVGSGDAVAGSATRGAVLLLGGSGPQDRDGSRADLPGYAPLRDLADSIARRGLAVLRLDDRGVGGSTGSFLGATSLDFARDAEHALAWLRARPDVAATRVVLVGHSEGALVALLAASRDSSIAGVVLLGAAARSGRDVARWQRRLLVTRDPSTWPVDQRAAVLAAADSNAERAALRDPWLRVWFALDPRRIAHGVRVPVLLVHGERDQQVPPAHALELADALRDAGATDVSVRLFPSTNHLLLADRDGDPTRYAQLSSRRVRGDVTRAVADWLVAHTRR